MGNNVIIINGLLKYIKGDNSIDK